MCERERESEGETERETERERERGWKGETEREREERRERESKPLCPGHVPPEYCSVCSTDAALVHDHIVCFLALFLTRCVFTLAFNQVTGNLHTHTRRDREREREREIDRESDRGWCREQVSERETQREKRERLVCPTGKGVSHSTVSLTTNWVV